MGGEAMAERIGTNLDGARLRKLLGFQLTCNILHCVPASWYRVAVFVGKDQFRAFCQTDTEVVP